jgi:hypothetical protein
MNWLKEHFGYGGDDAYHLWGFYHIWTGSILSGNSPFYTNLIYHPWGTQTVLHTEVLSKTFLLSFIYGIWKNPYLCYNLYIIFTFYISFIALCFSFHIIYNKLSIPFIIFFASFITFNPNSLIRLHGHFNFMSIDSFSLVFLSLTLFFYRRHFFINYIFVGASLGYVLYTDINFFLITIPFFIIISLPLLNKLQKINKLLFKLFGNLLTFILISFPFFFSLKKELSTVDYETVISKPIPEFEFDLAFPLNKLRQFLQNLGFPNLFNFPKLDSNIETEFSISSAYFFWFLGFIFFIVIKKKFNISLLKSLYYLAACLFIISLASGFLIKFNGKEICESIYIYLIDIPFYQSMRIPSRWIVILPYFMSFVIIEVQNQIKLGIFDKRLSFYLSISLIILFIHESKVSPIEIKNYYTLPNDLEFVRRDKDIQAVFNVPIHYRNGLHLIGKSDRDGELLALQFIHNKKIVDGFVSRNRISYNNRFRYNYFVIFQFYCETLKFSKAKLFLEKNRNFILRDFYVFNVQAILIQRKKFSDSDIIQNIELLKNLGIVRSIESHESLIIIKTNSL